jgi:hypothetical protein
VAVRSILGVLILLLLLVLVTSGSLTCFGRQARFRIALCRVAQTVFPPSDTYRHSLTNLSPADRELLRPLRLGGRQQLALQWHRRGLADRLGSCGCGSRHLSLRLWPPPAYANTSECWWMATDPSHPELSCTPLTQALLTSLEGASEVVPENWTGC